MFTTTFLNKETDLHKIHGTVEKLFPDQKKIYAIRGPQITVRSEKKCEQPGYRSRELDVSEYKAGEVFQFDIVLNPTRWSSSQGKYLSLKGKEAEEFVNSRFREAGFNVLDRKIIELGSVRISKLWDNKDVPRQSFVLNTIAVEGILEVTDEKRFEETLARGLPGRGKAYGFGMLNIIC